MQKPANVLRGDLEGRGIDTENPVLALVPHPVAIDPVPVPGAHLAGRNRHAAALLALEKLGSRTFELRSASPHAVLELGVEPFELARLAIELGEHLDLGSENFRNNGHRN